MIDPEILVYRGPILIGLWQWVTEFVSGNVIMGVVRLSGTNTFEVRPCGPCFAGYPLESLFDELKN